MKRVIKAILIMLAIAILGELGKVIFKIGTAPEPHRSVNPHSIFNG